MTTSVQLDYARICDQAQKTGETEALVENVFLLSLLLQKNYDAQQLLSHKQLSTQEKVEFINQLPGIKPSQVFKEVLTILIENKLLKSAQNLFEKISEILNETQNKVLVQLETAIPLSAEFENKIKKEISDATQKDIILKTFINEDVIAGVTVKFPGGKVYDFSYQRLLSDFKHYLREKN